MPIQPNTTLIAMSDHAAALAATLIRNFNEVPLSRLLREPQYDAQGARLA